MIRAHQPGSQPIDIPEVIPNPAVVPKQEPAPKEPAPKEPVKVPEKVSHKPTSIGEMRRVLEEIVGHLKAGTNIGVTIAGTGLAADFGELFTTAGP